MINADLQTTRSRLRSIATEAGLVLLYHGVWSDPPDTLAGGLHNVSPTVLASHLELVKESFRIVTVDEFAAASDRKGLAAVSFDDGYKCVLDEGLPVFESLQVPFTIYVNGSSFKRKVFWRDKVRFIDQRGLVSAFEAQMQSVHVDDKRRFYRYTKSPSNNSVEVVQELDRFLQREGLLTEVQESQGFCFDAPHYFLDHPLVAYGNHSEHHYVMSSLSAQQQADEIEATARLLEAQSGITVSRLFSIPFGEERDFNSATVIAAREAGYTGLLLSRARTHRADTGFDAMPAFERFMPREADLLGSLPA